MEYQRQLAFLKKKFDTGQLAHAYIVSGQDMASVTRMIDELVVYVACKFPDLRTIISAESDSSKKNEKDMMEIDIGQIREAQKFLSYKSYYGSLKMLVVQFAERMNKEAQNCFLKSLEEPKGKTLIILACQKPERLLETIFSRCQQVKLSGNKENESFISKDLQEVINGKLAQKFKYAKTVNLDGDNFTTILVSLQRYFRKILIGDVMGIAGVGQRYSVEKLKKIIRLIEQIIHQTETSNANNRLALEILLMEI